MADILSEGTKRKQRQVIHSTSARSFDEGQDREYPILSVRGISDIVGFKRDDKWTRYACETAAAFFFALLRVLPKRYL